MMKEISSKHIETTFRITMARCALEADLNKYDVQYVNAALQLLYVMNSAIVDLNPSSVSVKEAPANHSNRIANPANTNT